MLKQWMTAALAPNHHRSIADNDSTEANEEHPYHEDEYDSGFFATFRPP